MNQSASRLLRSTLLWAVLWTLVSSPTFAGGSVGITGRVTDPTGASVAGATVTIYARSSGRRITTVTNSNGEFRFERTETGDFIIEIAAAGFSQLSKTIQLEENQQTPLDFPLSVAATSTTVVVTANTTPQTEVEVSKTFSVVSSQEIERRNELSITESIRQMPGIRVQQLGGPGSQSGIFIRGLRSYDTAVVVDGLRLRDAASTQGDSLAQIQELFVVDTDRVEVVRGPESALYGTTAIGGVVNVVTAHGGGPVRGQIQLEGGSLGLFRGRAQVAGGAASDRFLYSAGLMHLNVSDGVDGDTPNRNWSGQGFVQYAFRPNITLSGRILGNTLFAQLTDGSFDAPGASLPPAGSIVKAVALPLDQQRLFEAGKPFTLGNANFISNLRDPDFRRDSSFLSSAVIFQHQINEKIGYRVNYQRVDTNRKFTDGPAGVRFEPDFKVVNRFDGVIDTLGVQGDWQLNRFFTFSAGYEFEREQYLGRDSDENPIVSARTNVGIDIEQRSHTFFLRNQFRAFDNRFQMSAAFRLQAFDLSNPTFLGGSSPYPISKFPAPETAYTGDGSISYFFRSTNTKLRSHVGSGYRAPSLFERFGSSYFGGFFSGFGDPLLRPERSIGVDAGIDQTFANNRVRVSATYFYTRLQEIVDFDFSGYINPGTDPYGRFFGYLNTGGGLSRGLELSLNTRPIDTLTVTASYTYANADNRRPTSVAGLLRTFVVPEHTFTLTANQQIGRRVEVNFDLLATSNHLFPFSGRAFEFKGPVKGDLVVSYTHPIGEQSLKVYGKVENMFDRTYFESGYRTPGATFLGGLAFRF